MLEQLRFLWLHQIKNYLVFYCDLPTIRPKKKKKYLKIYILCPMRVTTKLQFNIFLTRTMLILYFSISTDNNGNSTLELTRR